MGVGHIFQPRRDCNGGSMSRWRVRYYAPGEPDEESGATGFGSEEFARRVYRGLVELVEERRAGRVELLHDDEIAESFTVEGETK